MEGFKAIPQIFFDIIGRVVPGTVFIVLWFYMFGFDGFWRLVKGLANETEDHNLDKEIINTLLIISLFVGGFVAYIIGHLLSPVTKFIEGLFNVIRIDMGSANNHLDRLKVKPNNFWDSIGKSLPFFLWLPFQHQLAFIKNLICPSSIKLDYKNEDTIYKFQIEQYFKLKSIILKIKQKTPAIIKLQKIFGDKDLSKEPLIQDDLNQFNEISYETVLLEVKNCAKRMFMFWYWLEYVKSPSEEYEWLRLHFPEAGGICAKLRAEFTMYNGLSGVFLIFILINILKEFSWSTIFEMGWRNFLSTPFSWEFLCFLIKFYFINNMFLIGGFWFMALRGKEGRKTFASSVKKFKDAADNGPDKSNKHTIQLKMFRFN